MFSGEPWSDVLLRLLPRMGMPSVSSGAGIRKREFRGLTCGNCCGENCC